jgi:hypothetical protein
LPAVTTQNQVVREDLSDALILADVRNTPFTSRLRKGDTLENMFFQWPVTQMGNRNTTPPPENQDVITFEGDQEDKLFNRAQEFNRTPRVSKIAQRVNKAAGNFGKYDQQVTKKVLEQKRDVETVLLSSQDSADDTGTVGAKMLGIARVVNDGTLAWSDALTTIKSTYRTPTAQIYTGTLANLNDEAQLISIMKSRFDNLGQTTDLVLFAGSSLKVQISTYFGKYSPNKANFTTVVRTTQEALDSRKYAGYGIDVFEGDFGTFEIVLVPFIEDQKWGYGLNMEYMKMRPLMYCEHTPLPFQGGGMSGLIDSILGYEFGDPRGHFKIAAT